MRIALSLIEVAWPVASNELNRRLHDDAARPVREVWRRLAVASGALSAVMAFLDGLKWPGVIIGGSRSSLRPMTSTGC